MDLGRWAYGLGAGLTVLVCLARPDAALAISAEDWRTGPQRGELLATNARVTLGGTSVGAKPAPGATARGAAPEHVRARAKHPVHAVAATGAEQTGYVHYFLLRLPDDAVEIQVGIELPGGKIAWSFPGLGVVVSAFIEEGTLPVGGVEYEVWHLYGIRPFPDDASMTALRKDLAGRVQRWLDRQVPYCEHDGPRGDCMSCLGFVLRVLFPGRHSDYPDLPRDFRGVGTAGKYSTRDLLLYLTGMYDLPTRDARLQRIARLTLPDALREELSELVYAMGAAAVAAPASAVTPHDAAQKRPGAWPARDGTRPAQRRRL